MRSVIRWAVANSPSMNIIMISILVMGIGSAAMLRRELFPEFNVDMILVTVPYPGASPSETEEGICLKIEESIRSIVGVKKVTSVAREGAGFVIAELYADVDDPQRVLNEIRSEVDRIPSFPEQAEDPEIKEIVFRTPAIRLALVGGKANDSHADRELRDLAEQIRGEILQLPSVTQAEIMAARPYQIDIEIPEANLRKYGLTLRDVADAVRRENIEIPAGNIKTEGTEFLVRGQNKSVTGAGIASLPVLTQKNGVVLTVDDLGDVMDGFEDVTMYSQVDGEPSLTIEIQKTSSEDLLAIVEEVQEYAAERDLPQGYRLVVWNDQSIVVRDRLDLLTRSGLSGLILVFLCLSIFLNIRLAFWVALGIPISILGACAVMLYAGDTLNMLTMFAFLMALGIVVDDAIVIGEAVYAHLQMGKSPVEAAIDGTCEVAASVISSVATTVIAFMPLFFVSGVMGKFISVMPLAMIAMLLISLAEGLFILPCHLAHSPREESSWNRKFRTWVDERLDRFINHRYLPVLTFGLRHPAYVYSAALSCLLFAAGLYLGGFVPFVIFPKIDGDVIMCTVKYPNGTPSPVVDKTTRAIEKAIHSVAQEMSPTGKEDALLRMVYRSVGSMVAEDPSRPVGNGGHVGQVFVELTSVESRDQITSQNIIARWRELSGEFPGVEEITYGGAAIAPTAKAIDFKLQADDFGELERAVEFAKEELSTFAGVYDIGDDSQPGKWELQLKVRPEAEALGIHLADLTNTVRAAYYGEEVMRLQRGRHEIKLMVRYPEEERQSLANFDEIQIRTPEGDEIPLPVLADVSLERAYSEINRVDQHRAITVTADVDEAIANAKEITEELQAKTNFPRDLATARAAVAALAAQELPPQAMSTAGSVQQILSGELQGPSDPKLQQAASQMEAIPTAGLAPHTLSALNEAVRSVDRLQGSFVEQLVRKFPGVTVRWEGQFEQRQESMQSLAVGFIVAILVMFALLTLEFRSYMQPLIILAVIPFGTIGAVLGHLLLGLDLTLFSMFGLVALSGVVANDSIVLVDFINHRRAAGMPLFDALVDAGRRRFRPVMLTSITTVAGLTPILLERSLQAQVVIPMAVSLSFGLMMTTLWVLFLVPAMYQTYARWLEWQSAHPAEMFAPPEERKALSDEPTVTASS